MGNPSMIRESSFRVGVESLVEVLKDPQGLFL